MQNSIGRKSWRKNWQKRNSKSEARNSKQYQMIKSQMFEKSLEI